MAQVLNISNRHLRGEERDKRVKDPIRYSVVDNPMFILGFIA